MEIRPIAKDRVASETAGRRATAKATRKQLLPRRYHAEQFSRELVQTTRKCVSACRLLRLRIAPDASDRGVADTSVPMQSRS